MHQYIIWALTLIPPSLFGGWLAAASSACCWRCCFLFSASGSLTPRLSCDFCLLSAASACCRLRVSYKVDKVDTNTAIQKLLQMHVRPELLPWFSDFLSNRQQCVRLGKTTFQWSAITCGIPQGTKVGPVSFLAKVNDLASTAPSKWTYVDDITIGESRPNTSIAPSSSLPGIMNNISNQASCDHMILNVSKCGLMQLSFGRDPPSLPQITTNNQTIPLITSMTLLGVTISPSLNWDAHVKKMVSKANTKRYFLVVLRHAGTSLEQLVKFYTMFIRPGLEYAAPVWHPGLAQQLLDTIECVQTSSLYIVYPDLSYGRVLEETGLPPLHARWEQLCLGFAQFLYANDQFIDWFLLQRQSLHGQHLRNKSAINIPKCKTNRTLTSPMSNLLSSKTFEQLVVFQS